MKVIEPGHVYQLQHLDGTGAGMLVFVNRESGTEHEGVQTQEVLRALIDRTQHCDQCLRWDGNDKIIQNLRMALALHEARAIERKAEKGVIQPEKVPVAADGHFEFREVMPAKITVGDSVKLSDLAKMLKHPAHLVLTMTHLMGYSSLTQESWIDFDTARSLGSQIGVEVIYSSCKFDIELGLT